MDIHLSVLPKLKVTKYLEGQKSKGFVAELAGAFLFLNLNTGFNYAAVQSVPVCQLLQLHMDMPHQTPELKEKYSDGQRLRVRPAPKTHTDSDLLSIPRPVEAAGFPPLGQLILTLHKKKQ